MSINHSTFIIFVDILALLLIALFSICYLFQFDETKDQKLITGKVTRVIDGDTIVVDGERKVRLADIDCPEVGGAEGKYATEYTTNHLLDRNVGLLVTGHDNYGRTVAHVFIMTPTGEPVANFNKWLVVSGHAVIKDYPDTLHPFQWCPELIEKYPVQPYEPGKRMRSLPESYQKLAF
ncbi:MAG: thermonuclease family protein [Methanotrichaceae archaeon]